MILSLPSGPGTGVSSVIRLPASAVSAATADAATSDRTGGGTAIPPRRRAQDAAPIVVQPPVFTFTPQNAERAPVSAYSSPYLAQMLAQALPGDPDSISLFFAQDSTLLNHQVMQLFSQIKYMPSNAGQVALARMAAEASAMGKLLPSNDNALPAARPVKTPGRSATLTRQSGVAAYQGTANRVSEQSRSA